MIYQTIDFTDFRDAFRNYNRLDNFSYEGSRILFDYLEQLSYDTGEDWELDVIALCCEFAEMTEDEVRENYTIHEMQTVTDYLYDHTMLCGMYEDESGETVYLFQQF